MILIRSFAKGFMELVGQRVRSGTQITFPRGDIQGSSKVVAVARGLADGKIALLLESTPFHPVDKKWPDQPADKGVLKWGDETFTVEDCQVYAVHKETQEVKEGAQIPKADRANWLFTVAHIIDAKIDPLTLLDAEMTAYVDKDYRDRLSLHHTACHLAALALNKATQELWSKPTDLDSLGSPNTDKMAIHESSIFPDHSADLYRLGKSIRKAGLSTDELLSHLGEIQERVNAQVAAWLKTEAPITMRVDKPEWDSSRLWSCVLPEGTAELPCGGTHVSSLAAFSRIEYTLALEERGSSSEKYFCAITKATPRHA